MLPNQYCGHPMCSVKQCARKAEEKKIAEYSNMCEKRPEFTAAQVTWGGVFSPEITWHLAEVEEVLHFIYISWMHVLVSVGFTFAAVFLEFHAWASLLQVC